MSKPPGQIAYEAYCAASRRIASPWELKDRFERLMWNECAAAVVRACADEVEAMKEQSKNHLFRSALSVAAAELRARAKP